MNIPAEERTSERYWIRRAILVHLAVLTLFFAMFAGSFFKDCAQCGMEIIFILPVYFPAYFVTRLLNDTSAMLLDLSRMTAKIQFVIIFWFMATAQIYIMAKVFIGLGRKLSSLAQRRRKTDDGITSKE